MWFCAFLNAFDGSVGKCPCIPITSRFAHGVVDSRDPARADLFVLPRDELCIMARDILVRPGTTDKG